MIERICWIVLALIHLTPTVSFFVPSLHMRLYGDASGDLGLLLHHRSALFGVVLIACIWAIFAPEVSKLAVVIAAISMASFLALYFAAGSPPALRSIAIADLIGAPFLAYLAWRAFFAG